MRENLQHVTLRSNYVVLGSRGNSLRSGKAEAAAG